MSVPHRELVAEGHPALSPGAHEVLQFLKQHGASFFADIVRGTRKLKAEIETALWELVAVGFITADGFDNLRALIDPKRRAGQGSGRSARPRDSVGRWSLLFPGEPANHAAQMEGVCWMLLRRYGVVFLGEQFALPIAVESLRAGRTEKPTGTIMTISAADPLNLAGILVPGEKVPALSGRFVSFRDGLVVEQNHQEEYRAGIAQAG